MNDFVGCIHVLGKGEGYKLYNLSNGKIVIGRDVEFDEERSWEWKIQNEDYNFNPFFDDEEEMVQPTTPPPTPPSQNPQVEEASSSVGSLLTELHQTQDGLMNILVDNKSALALAKNPVFYERSKHIDTKYHFIRECVSKKEVELEYMKSQDQVADIFTKPLKIDVFHKLRMSFGLMNQIKAARAHSRIDSLDSFYSRGEWMLVDKCLGFSLVNRFNVNEVYKCLIHWGTGTVNLELWSEERPVSRQSPLRISHEYESNVHLKACSRGDADVRSEEVAVSRPARGRTLLQHIDQKLHSDPLCHGTTKMDKWELRPKLEVCKLKAMVRRVILKDVGSVCMQRKA
ncbi:hypothetical protein RJ639_038023 [Escallonia herrerae]|uniref:Retroviral polymerase SH3-like domain-containing protein n=1 Tax=Escallonia herrerae TaxID=1293975 RepID=A0AA89BF87_9ASTE|nr:hypothetical protein RJ639_038023 [Escallonia herrerae]